MQAMFLPENLHPLGVIGKRLIPWVIAVEPQPTGFLLEHLIRRYDSRLYLFLSEPPQVESQDLPCCFELLIIFARPVIRRR